MRVDPQLFQQSLLYFAVSLALISIYALLYIWRDSNRNSSLISAVMSMTTAIYALVFVPEYWNPPQLYNFHPGIEDAIFSFANGGIVWLLVCPTNHDLQDSSPLRKQIMRYLAFSFSFLTMIIVFLISGLPVMYSVLLSSFVICLYLAKQTYKQIWLAIRGGIYFTLFYTIVLFITLAIDPAFINSWNYKNLIGISIIGIPLEEYLWAFAYGFIWPLFIYFVLFGKSQKAEDRHSPGC